MKKFMPLQIGEFTPMTIPEMKNVFGGSGETGSGKACAVEGSECKIEVKYEIKVGDQKIYDTSEFTGKCTSASGTQVEDGLTYPTTYCKCEHTATINVSGTASFKKACIAASQVIGPG